MPETERQIVIGGIYRHCHGLKYRVDTVGLNVTGYEKGRDTFPPYVVYTQLEDGKFPAGTVWVREKPDFLGTTTQEDGQTVNTFELVQGKT